jgi:hypothetical protein
MAEQASAGLSETTLKVLTFAGPLFASSLAITYDVGFFVGIGISFFSFFSLTEHFVFALQSLPFAIPPAALLLMGFSTGRYAYQAGHRDWALLAERSEQAQPSDEVPGESAHQKLSLLGRFMQRSGLAKHGARVVPFLLAGLFLSAYSLWHQHKYAEAFLTLVGLAVAVSLHNKFRWLYKDRLSWTIIAVAVAVGSLIVSYLTGIQRAEAVLMSKQPSETISVENGSLPARLIRGGDKGVLFFSLDSKKVRFLRWDAIKQIETL